MWWKPLVHVCQRWRQLIFASPRSLRLTVVCNPRTPVRKLLNIWPPFPISVHHSARDRGGEDENTITMLKLRDRVAEISINSQMGSVLGRFTAEMLESFPALVSLSLGYGGDMAPAPVLPASLLGGSAPSLQTILLSGIAFPALPTLLSSTAQLTSLQLWKTPITGYISPEAMATCLGQLPNLEDLRIEFNSPHEDPRPPFPTRFILPSLTSFRFEGASEYSESLLARIDAPILQTLSITFCDIILHIPQLYHFISCAKSPESPSRVIMGFDYWRVELKFIPSNDLELVIGCENLTGHLSSMAVVCRDLSPLLSRVERLDFRGDRGPWFPVWLDGIGFPTELDWLGLFSPFVTVQSLCVSKELVPNIACALEGLVKERATAVFPKLRSLFLEELQPSGSVRSAVEAFVATRWFSDHPVTFQQRLPLDSDTRITLSPFSWPAWYWDPTSDD